MYREIRWVPFHFLLASLGKMVHKDKNHWINTHFGVHLSNKALITASAKTIFPTFQFSVYHVHHWQCLCSAGEVNGGFMGDAHSVAGSRKSLNLHPVLLMPQPGDTDRFSEFSNRTGRSKASAFRPEYATSMHNFQL